MKRYFTYVIVIFSIFFLTTEVEAAKSSCDSKTIIDYRELAGNINIYSDYRMVDGKPLFDVTITNLPKNVYVTDMSTKKTYHYQDFTTENELIIRDYSDNQRINYKFYLEAPGCYGQVLNTRNVSLPNYNEFADDPVCEGAEGYSLCQKWGVISIEYEDFVSRVNDYKAKKQQQENPTPKEDGQSLKEMIFNFIGKYYIFLVSGITIIVLLLAALKTKASEQNEFDFKV